MTTTTPVDEPTTFDEAARRIGKEIAELLVKKQRGYGKGNILKFGKVGVLVRASDKVERLINLVGPGKYFSPEDIIATEETVNDTWRDLAGYAVIAIMLERGYFNLPLKPLESNKEKVK